jgi:flagellar hook-length control protein FliK
MSALTASASMSLIASAAPAPQVSPPPPQADNGFARCLDQARDDNEAAPADETPQRQNVKKPAPRARAERAARESGAARAAGSGDTPPQKPTADAETQAAADAAQPTHHDTTAPDLAALLPGWAPPPPAASAAPSDSDATALLPTSMAAKGASAASALPHNDLATRALAQVEMAAATAADVHRTPAIASSAELQAAASEQRVAAPELASATLPNAPVAAPATPLTSKAAEAPPPTATLPPPIDSPAFAPALATQVRWWASDGVQQAQLLLNPAEMGPVRVNIVLDGRDARIDFSADLAATRGAIEAALPVLAAALDDGGLKLTGGGVHDGSAQHRREGNDRGVTHRTPSGPNSSDTAAPSVAAHNAVARGMVDLVA